MPSTLNVVILAAGKGTRMKSDRPKVLHTLAGRPLLQHVIDTAFALTPTRTIVVVGHGAEQVRASVRGDALEFCLQDNQLGTGHAVAQTLDRLEDKARVLVLYGDVPLTSNATLQAFLQGTPDEALGLLTCVMTDPKGLGRILRDDTGRVAAIVEEKDASAAQKSITEVNTGIMLIPAARLKAWLPKLGSNNAQGEVLLTDIVAMAVQDKVPVRAVVCPDQLEVSGVNDKKQLAILERYFQKRRADQLMLDGVTLRDPSRIDLRGEVSIGADVEIDVNVILEGRVEIGAGSIIGASCVIRNCRIGAGSRIEPFSHLDDAQVGDGCSIGPFARIRPGTELGDGARIGNFVETKKARIGKDSKVNHLSYVGDSDVGEGANIGAGTITCNYDGANKHKTVIGNKVFIGSNAVLVAPVTVADGAFVAAGSVITKNIGSDELGIGRSRQVNKSGWRRPEKNGK